MLDDIHVKTYKCLDIRIKNDAGDELICDCQLCGAKDKLYIEKTEGFFNCKVCGAEGNKYTYMNKWYEMHLGNTGRDEYNLLSRNRDKLPYEAFEDVKLAYNKKNKEWIIPVYGVKGNLVNLRIWNKDNGIMKHLGGCSASIFGREQQSKSVILMCEGEWDAIALRWLAKQNNVEDVSIWAAPGATTFKDEWCNDFTDKEVVFLYDNDIPGKDGQKRAIKLLVNSKKFGNIQKITWDEGLPDKYDIRDFVTKYIRDPQKGWIILQNLIKDISDDDKPTVKEFTRKTFEEVYRDYSKAIYMTDEIRNGLILLFSVIFSNKLKDSPLWLFIVGPPSSGKTLILNSVWEEGNTHYESCLGPKTLISGFKGDVDPSLLPRLIGKTLIIKEYTEIMSLSSSEQEQIFSTLRGVYDGRVDKSYGNNIVRIYPEPGSGHDTCHFSILAGVTNVIHGASKAALGERFLKYQMFAENMDTTPIVQRAIDCSLNQYVPELELRKTACAFIRHKLSRPIIIPTVPIYIQQKILGLSQIVSRIRAQVDRRNGGDLIYRPVPEVGARLAKQLIKLLQMIAFTLDKKEVDDECYTLARRVALDTCTGWQRDAILVIAKHEKGVFKKQIMDEAKLRASTCDLALEDLMELKAVKYTVEMNGNAGAPARRWMLTDKIKEEIHLAKLLDTKLIDIPREDLKGRRDRSRVVFKRPVMR